MLYSPTMDAVQPYNGCCTALQWMLSVSEVVENLIKYFFNTAKYDSTSSIQFTMFGVS
jgi:hypothetical protein